MAPALVTRKVVTRSMKVAVAVAVDIQPAEQTPCMVQVEGLLQDLVVLSLAVPVDTG